IEATEVKLSSELGGRVLTRPVDEGDPVRRGRVLATFDTDLIDHQIRTAPDMAAQAHLERQRDRQTLRSPIDGWVVRTVFEPEEQVPPGAPVVVVAGWPELTLTAYLPRHQFGRVALGGRPSISADAYPGESYVRTVNS